MAASTQKKKTPAKKPSSGSKTTRSAGTNASNQKKPVRREVWALVCFCLALFTFIGCFRIDALFITYFCGFVKGLIGYGYYLFPLALLGCAGILLLHRGRPVRARTVCSLCVPVALGALAHLALCKLDLGQLKLPELLPTLYENGKEMTCGGLICGFLAIAFEKLFSVYGAVPVFLFGAIALLMIATRLTPGKLAEMVKQHAANRPQYVPEPDPEPAPAPARPVRQTRAANPATAAFPTSARKGHAIDIPVDDAAAQEYEENKVGFFNRNPRVKTPDQLLEQQNAADTAVQQVKTPAPMPLKPEPVNPPQTPVTKPVSQPALQPEKPAANLTAQVKPMTEEEAAEMAGVTLQKPEETIRTEEFSTAAVREQR